MLEAETAAFLEGGCALIVGTVSPTGAPHASRGWGITVIERDPVRVRLLLNIDDERVRENLEATAALAVTAGDVRTLRSLQLKGRADQLEPASDSDRSRAASFCDEFFTDVVEIDGTARAIVERWVPSDYLACTMTVGEVYDQTPGPGAGAPMPRPSDDR